MTPDTACVIIDDKSKTPYNYLGHLMELEQQHGVSLSHDDDDNGGAAVGEDC